MLYRTNEIKHFISADKFLRLLSVFPSNEHLWQWKSENKHPVKKNCEKSKGQSAQHHSVTVHGEQAPCSTTLPKGRFFHSFQKIHRIRRCKGTKTVDLNLSTQRKADRRIRGRVTKSWTIYQKLRRTHKINVLQTSTSTWLTWDYFSSKILPHLHGTCFLRLPKRKSYISWESHEVHMWEIWHVFVTVWNPLPQEAVLTKIVIGAKKGLDKIHEQ